MFDENRIILFKELVNMERHGVSLWLDDIPTSPADIANSDVLCEEAVYMRDYVTDEKGVLVELHFDRVIPDVTGR